MRLLVVLGTVLSSAVVATERAESAEGKAPAPPHNYSRISLPPEHVPYFLNNNKKVAKQCRSDPRCPYKDALRDQSACWGYEKNCDRKKSFGFPVCTKADSGWAHSIDAAQELFWKQADFGYVKERLSELKTLCKASKPVC